MTLKLYLVWSLGARMFKRLIEEHSMRSSPEAFIKDRIILLDLKSFGFRGTFPQRFKILKLSFARHQSMSFYCLTNSENSQISCKVCQNEVLSFYFLNRLFVFLLLIFT